MYGNDQNSEFGMTVPARDDAARHGELGRQIASLCTVAMLIGVAISAHAWMPPGWERTALIMFVSGIGGWVLIAFALHLASERWPLLAMLFPTLIFLGVMLTVLGLVHRDYPKGQERIEQPAVALEP